MSKLNGSRQWLLSGKWYWVSLLFIAAQSVTFTPTARASTIDFTNCGNGVACPYVTYGDGNSYSLALNALFWDHYQGGGTGPGNPFYVNSSPGAIKNDIVVATGASGGPVNTNFPNMDNAYPTPNETAGTVFFTTNKSAYSLPIAGVSAPTDPAPSGFTGDTPNTWDTTLSALQAAIGTGNTPIFFFNNNQVNSGASTNQDLAVWAQIILTDSTGALANKYFDFTNRDHPFTEPGGGVVNGDPTAYTDLAKANPIAGDNTATDYVLSGGQLCLDSSFLGQACNGSQTYTVNNNLGANQAAYAVVFPELNSILTSTDFGGYDSMSIDFRMGCDPNTTGYNQSSTGNCTGRSINNGYEQLFIASTTQVVNVPEPGTLLLMGAGLTGLVVQRRFKLARTQKGLAGV